ncbi:reverse transcriptase domain-containing protein [Trichonephila clavipes]|nr:reverse transcriptase domain-containing protein [Trichonephila clavipes]
MRLIERAAANNCQSISSVVRSEWTHDISIQEQLCPFCRKRNLHPDPSIHIGHIPIPVVSAVRFLGVIFDCKLTFLPHVLYLRKRCERSQHLKGIIKYLKGSG